MIKILCHYLALWFTISLWGEFIMDSSAGGLGSSIAMVCLCAVAGLERLSSLRRGDLERSLCFTLYSGDLERSLYFALYSGDPERSPYFALCSGDLERSLCFALCSGGLEQSPHPRHVRTVI